MWKLGDKRQPWERRRDKARARLRAALDKPIAPSSEDGISHEYFDPWEDLIDGCIGPYSSEIDRLAIDVLKAIRDRKTFEFLETDRGLAAELFMHMLADWLCDYGTSPRAAFPAHGLDEMWDELIEKWEAYAEVEWGEDW